MSCFAQPTETNFVHLKESKSFIFEEDEIAQVLLVFEVTDPLHIQSEDPSDTLVIPTEIQFNQSEKTKVEVVEYVRKDEANLDRSVEEIYGQFVVLLEISNDEIAKESLPLSGNLSYQACSETQCFFPRTLDFEVQID